VAYHRVSTVIFVPAPSGAAVEMVNIDPLKLEAAQDQDAAMHEFSPRRSGVTGAAGLATDCPERQPCPQDCVTISSGRRFRQAWRADRTIGEKAPAPAFSCPASASSFRGCSAFGLWPHRPPVGLRLRLRLRLSGIAHPIPTTQKKGAARRRLMRWVGVGLNPTSTVVAFLSEAFVVDGKQDRGRACRKPRGVVT
jgi:hypothetical protein